MKTIEEIIVLFKEYDPENFIDESHLVSDIYNDYSHVNKQLLFEFREKIYKEFLGEQMEEIEEIIKKSIHKKLIEKMIGSYKEAVEEIIEIRIEKNFLNENDIARFLKYKSENKE